jgi:enoyl-[acyl-carrier protein] reductase II
MNLIDYSLQSFIFNFQLSTLNSHSSPMIFSNRITRLFKIDYPIIQAGMVWASGWRLASAVSNAGGLGLIGSGSMYPEILKEHIQKCKAATSRSFGVNVPLLYPEADQHIEIIISEQVPVVFTSAGNPKTYTSLLKQHGITVVHVVSSSKFAVKAQEAGCDAVVAEGFEAGGHNGREETTTMVLVPAVCNSVAIPVIAAGGIASGRQMLSADGIRRRGSADRQRFVASKEASSHAAFKAAVVNAKEGDTMLALKELTPVRMMKNKFYNEIREAEQKGSGADELKRILGRGRAKKGMFEGDLDEGELEIGQAAALINSVQPAADIVKELWLDFEYSLKHPLK